MNPKYGIWIAAAGLLVILIILCAYGSTMAWREWRNRQQGGLGQREPLPSFGYCNLRQARPCILSFNLDADGDMVIQILTDSLEDFYIKIKYEEGEHMYVCQRATQYSRNVACTGAAVPVGETLNFLLISKEANTTLAQGSFPIIGLALATPEISVSPTPILFDHKPR